MAFSKEEIKYRYLLDIATGILHDLRSEDNPDNQGCGLDGLESWVVFDTEREPFKGALIKKLTATKEVVGIEVRKLCSQCMKPEDEDIVGLLKDYFLASAE